MVVAREDDFTHGLLTSEVFTAWAEAYRPDANWAAIVSAFPFPWPPQTPLGGLSATQEEHRHAIARAARAGDRDRLNDAVLKAYDWNAGLEPSELHGRLRALHAARR